MTKILRPHQVRALDLLRDSLRSGHKRPLLQAPTGFGKTLVASKIAEGAHKKGNHSIFCVPAISLIDQTVQAFKAEGMRVEFDPANIAESIESNDIGVIQADHELTNPHAPIQIASAQTLMRRAIPSAGVVQIDEAHRWFEFYGNWMGEVSQDGQWSGGMPEWRNVPFIGLSATPGTKGLGKHYDDLLVPTTVEELIDKGYLSPFRVFVPSHPDLSKVRTVAGDFQLDDLAEVMSDSKLVADVVENWCRHGEGRPTLCFAVDRAHAKQLQARFHAAGVQTDYVDAFTGREERKEIEDRFRSGETKVVCNVGVLTTGVDWDVRCIILARPTKSEMLFVQIIGRGLRPVYADWFDQSCEDDEIRVKAIVEGPKPDCIIFDHSDTHLRLGFVTDIHFTELDRGLKIKAERKEKPDEDELPKECTKCGYLKPAKVHQCPACGFKAEKQSEIAEAQGELEEITKKGAKRALATTEQKRDVYGQLARYAYLQGHSKGWIYHKFKEYFGFYPHATIERSPQQPVTPEIASWIKSRNIAWAKSRKKKGDSLAA